MRVLNLAHRMQCPVGFHALLTCKKSGTNNLRCPVGRSETASTLGSNALIMHDDRSTWLAWLSCSHFAQTLLLLAETYILPHRSHAHGTSQGPLVPIYPYLRIPSPTLVVAHRLPVQIHQNVGDSTLFRDNHHH